MAQDESEATKQTDDRSYDRSPPFPFIPLEKAIERATQFEAHYKKSAGRVSNVLPIWQYTAKSSGGQQTIGALKAYGLLEDEGSGADRKVKLTDLAMRILKDERPGKRDEAIKEAALKPKALSEHWTLWGNDRPPDAECRSELTLERHYTEDAAARLLRVYDENLKYARLGLSDKIADKQPETAPIKIPKIGDLIQWESAGVLKLPEPKRVTGIAETGDYLFVEGHLAGIPIKETNVVAQTTEQPSNLAAGQAGVAGAGVTTAPIKPAPFGARQDTLTLDEGVVVLQYPAKMSADGYEDFEGWIQLQLRKIKRGIEQ